MNNAITIDGIAKKYILRHQMQKRASYSSLRDVMAETVQRWGKRVLHPLSSGRKTDLSSFQEDFWALKDVSFNIAEGERIGIIGRNGAGKSTLLKILSRITEPTEGEVTIQGRVASLLEVGTGFHPELTGRENIYLNGAILGMTKAEISRKFDEIVDFAGVERFLDTPVKRYSSGMHVRLAFAVAAHLEPEILLVDEVLAVGDAEFQKKCLGKMKDVGSEGRTVLLVSHNMTAMSSLCSKIVVLNNGAVDFIGPTDEGITRYLTSSGKGDTNICADLRNHYGAMLYSQLTKTEVLNERDEPATEFRMGDAVKFRISFTLTEDIPNLEVGFHLLSVIGTQCGHFIGEWEGMRLMFSQGEHSITCEIPHIHCFPGTYGISPWLKRRGGGADDQVDFAIEFSVVGSDLTGSNPDFDRYQFPGIYQKSNWRIER